MLVFFSDEWNISRGGSDVPSNLSSVSTHSYGKNLWSVHIVDFQEMIITESRREIVGDIQELEIFGLETHVAVSFYSELDWLSLNEVGK